MSVSPALLRYQGPMLATLARVALSSLRGVRTTSPPATPGPTLSAEVSAPPADLVDSYVAWADGEAQLYRHELPPSFFPQWGFPLLSRTLEGLPYRLSAVLNQGCRVEVRGAVPRGVPLRLQARLESVEEEETKIRLDQKLVTGTAADPELHVAHVFAVIPKARGKKADRRADDTRTFRTVGSWTAAPLDGLRFGVLTGDMNPIHWLPPYARLAGFPRQILHGFGTLARTWEILRRTSGQPLRGIDVRFLRPLVLPARVDVEVSAGAPKDEVPFRVTGGETLYAAGQFKT